MCFGLCSSICRVGCVVIELVDGVGCYGGVVEWFCSERVEYLRARGVIEEFEGVLVYDLGRVVVFNIIWDKLGLFICDERDWVEFYVLVIEQFLCRMFYMVMLVVVVGVVYECFDGIGYYWWVFGV